ncbi:MAG: hypothetical protein JWQ96_3492 [Segetibacter sp.]|nr:hypothetical protein [Segetibacter sp.]
MKKLLLLGVVLYSVGCTNPVDHANQEKNDSNYTDDKTLNSNPGAYDNDKGTDLDTSHPDTANIRVQ